MKVLLSLLFIAIFSFSFGQKRIGFDVNTHLVNLNYTVHYQEVIKGPLLYSVGIFAGRYGIGDFTASDAQISNDYLYPNAFPSIASEFVDSTGSYNLVGQHSVGSGVGLSAGIGLFHEFGPAHGIRFNINQRFGWMRTTIRSTYRANYLGHSQVWHPVMATSLELNHTIRLSGRTTFYWGIKAPYYFTLDKGRFNPKMDSEVFHKMKADLSIGLTRVVGKCD